MATGTYISIITLNVNGLNALIKRYRLAEWIQKQDPFICAVYEKPTSDLKTHIDWKWEDGKIYSMQMGSKRKLEEQSSYQTKYTLKKITRDKEGHYIMIKGSIQEEAITIVNIYVHPP